MIERLLWCNRGELIFRSIAKGSAGCSQNQPFDFLFSSPTKALMNGVVFAVNRKNFDLAAPGGCRDQFASIRESTEESFRILAATGQDEEQKERRHGSAVDRAQEDGTRCRRAIRLTEDE